MDPIQTFQHERISVLTDSSYHEGRVFLETAGKLRVFGNVWALNDCIIFKDLSGKLEGESVVGASIQRIPNMWCFVGRSGFGPELAPSPNATATQITSAAGVLIQDWREPIRQMLRSPGTNIRITDKPWGSRITTAAAPAPAPAATRASPTVGP
ncbi:hypothetical protein DFH94DRAFT_755681 [Russula ochroleuca]|uniref:Uncharacterized protein n=1 Tax=Russula ochroleuca TaxID=152965 RepID=A0A9P5T735_9AGAM|nr:hypothetical protein DFH94DRAFT_755681 [Russula ochroleuca]